MDFLQKKKQFLMPVLMLFASLSVIFIMSGSIQADAKPKEIRLAASQQEMQAISKCTIASVPESSISRSLKAANTTTPGTITLTFNAQGGTTVNPVKITEGSNLPSLPKSTKTGYYLEGWYTAIEGGDKITTETVHQKDATYYAHWQLNVINSISAEYSGKYLITGMDDWVDKSELHVYATYLDGRKEEITTYSIDDYKISEGENVLTVRYQGKTSQIKVTGVSVINIGTIYRGGPKQQGTTSLNNLDLTVIAELSNGETAYRMSGFTIDPFSIQVGTNTLIVRFAGKASSFNVTGQAGPVVDSPTNPITGISAQYHGIAVHTGSYVSKSDITVTARYADGTTNTVTDFTLDNYLITRGSNVLTVRYGGHTATIIVRGDDVGGRVTYQILFDSQGGNAVEPIIVEPQAFIYNIPVCTKAGSNFQGWYSAVNGGGTKLTPTTRITGDTVFYAFWSNKSISGISAYYSGTAYAGANVSDGLVVTINYSDGTTERTNAYTLSSQLLTAGSNQIVVSYDRFQTTVNVTAVQANGGNNNNGSTVNPNLPSYYVINFHANGGTNLSGSKVTIEAGGQLGELPEAERRNYIFKGWYTDYEDGEKVSFGTVPRNSMTLYAHWSKVSKPAKSAVSSLKSKKSKQLKVSCKKVSGAAGYEVAYSTKKDFSSSVKKKAGESASKTIKNLKKGKKYYVKVRAYKLDSTGQKVYGTYSAKKSVKVK